MSVIKKIFTINRKTFVNPSAWIQYQSIATENRTYWTIFKNLFSKPVPAEGESFAEAMKRLALTDADVVSRAHQYRRYALFFAALTLVGFLYGFYLLFRYGTFTGWLLAMAVAALFASQAFQYDFWAFQMRKRKLGLTFAEYKAALLSDKGNT